METKKQMENYNKLMEKIHIEQNKGEKVTQKQKVKEYILSKGNKPLKYDIIANALNIKIPNVRRILGQGIFSNDFERVSRGFYIVKKEEEKTSIKNDNDII